MIDAAERELLNGLRWDRAGDERLARLGEAEWNTLWRVVTAGAGQSFLARRVQQTGVRPPPDIETQLRRHVLNEAAHNLAARAKVSELLKATGRPALLLKGIDLAERLYGNLGMRRMGDVDILVRVEDLAAFDTRLRAGGYTSTPALDDGIITSGRFHHLIYRSQERRARMIELHWQLADDEDGAGIDLDGIWQRAQPCPAVAAEARVMAPEDLFLYLCLHIWHHTFDTALTQVWDLAELLQAPSLPIDWPLLWARAEQWRLTNVVRVSLYQVEAALGVATRRFADWSPDAALAGLLPDTLAQLGRYPLPNQAAPQRVAILFSSHTSWKERLEVAKAAVLPARAEVRAVFGRPDDGVLGDARSYLRRWRYLIRTRGALALRRITGHSGIRDSLDRVAAIRRIVGGGKLRQDD